MIINKAIFSLFFIILHTVTSSGLSDTNNEEKQNVRRYRGSYKFNHPPAAEEYLTIPVAVVTDDTEARKGKSSKIDTKLASKENIEVKNTTNTKSATSKTELSTPKTEPSTLKKGPSKPNIEPSTPKTEQSTPKTELSTPKTEPSTPKKEPSKPNTEPSTPKTEPSTPKTELSTSKPDASSTFTLSPSKNEVTIQPVKENKEDVEVKRKSKSENLFQIPVSIIYEPEAKIQEKSNNNLNIAQSERSTGRAREERNQRDPTDVKKTNKIKNVKESASDNKPKEIAANTSKSEVIQKKNEISDIKLKNEVKDSSTSIIKPVENKNDDTKNEATSNNSQNKNRTRQRDPVVPIVEMENYIYSHTGEFRYSYEGGDGTKAFETGELKSIDNEKTVEAVSGGFSYKDKDGNDISLTYIADENGYRPVGAHLPTPPPIPPAIARALKYLATKTTPEPITKSPKNSKPSTEKDSKSSTEKYPKVSDPAKTS